MKVYIMTKARQFQKEEYVAVKKSKKECEKAFRDMFPYMRKSDSGENYVSDKDLNHAYLLFIHEEEV